jgi:DNA-binding GntR family transcriptional regulator
VLDAIRRKQPEVARAAMFSMVDASRRNIQRRR